MDAALLALCCGNRTRSESKKEDDKVTELNLLGTEKPQCESKKADDGNTSAENTDAECSPSTNRDEATTDPIRDESSELSTPRTLVVNSVPSSTDSEQKVHQDHCGGDRISVHDLASGNSEENNDLTMGADRTVRQSDVAPRDLCKTFPTVNPIDASLAPSVNNNEVYQTVSTGSMVDKPIHGNLASPMSSKTVCKTLSTDSMVNKSIHSNLSSPMNRNTEIKKPPMQSRRVSAPPKVQHGYRNTHSSSPLDMLGAALEEPGVRRKMASTGAIASPSSSHAGRASLFRRVPGLQQGYATKQDREDLMSLDDFLSGH